MSAALEPERRQPKTLRTLVLNADFRPMGTWPLSLIGPEEAIRAVY